MKHLTRKLIILPIIIFVISIGFILFAYYFTLKSFEKDLISYEAKILLNKKKENVKEEVKLVKESFIIIRNILYENLSIAFKNILYKALEEYQSTSNKSSWLKEHFMPEHFFFAVFDKNATFPKDAKLIEKDHRKFVLLNNKKYFYVYEKLGNKLFGIALPNSEIEKEYITQIKKFLDEFNKNKVEYIAMGKIKTFNPSNGNFGEIIYMPKRLKFLEGKVLNYNKRDIKGNLYRKTYFEAFKNGKDDIFVSYYFKNPKTLKYEKKYSYFSIIRPDNYVLVKGFYKSEIENMYKDILKKYKNGVSKAFYFLLFLSIIILILGIFVIFTISKRIVDIIEEDYEILKEELFKQFYFDSLTHLPNRNKLLNDIKMYESLILIDIDDFSIINEIYGFKTGDKILKKVAYILKTNYHFVYRMGSDEFAIAFKEKITKEVVEKIISKEIKTENISLHFIAGASNVKPLLENCEMALKQAIKDKKSFYLFDKDIYDIQKEKLNKLNLLKKILNSKGIEPFYQCIVDKDGIIIKYEALMRLVYDNKIYSPFEFLSFLKESKMYIKFSKIMLEKVFNDIKTKKVENVSINLSYEDIENEEMREFILKSISSVAEKITFEILESEEIKDYKILLEFLKELKQRGVKIAIDDFGSGYSNFVEVLKINPDYIKIDASLVKNIHEEKYFKIISLIVEFCKDFNIQSVAEFVDSEEKFKILKELGVDYYQGYYFCKPIKL